METEEKTLVGDKFLAYSFIYILQSISRITGMSLRCCRFLTMPENIKVKLVTQEQSGTGVNTPAFTITELPQSTNLRLMFQ